MKEDEEVCVVCYLHKTNVSYVKIRFYIKI